MIDRAAARDVAVRCLHDLAPEADLAALDGGALLHEALDLDSFDFLRLVQAVTDATGVEIDVLDFPNVATLDGLVEHLVGQR
jgi:acyl carrier protein